jgi:dolichol-phosphate mannosyltransferase
MEVVRSTTRALDAAQAAAALAVLARLARGRRRRPPLGAAPPPPEAVTVVVPARDEAARIGPCLRGLLADADIAEVLVVDDGSADGTAALAAAMGARVVAAGEPPEGWVGKPWALQRGLEVAVGEIVVSVDADTRPRPGLARALAAALGEPGGRAAFVCAGARFVCDTPAERWLHPAMLATLVYRYGPPDAIARRPPARLLANGQCTAVRRRPLLAAGGYRPAAGAMTDDAAQARALARAGWEVAFHDGGGLIDVDMHESAAETWREWGRSIALPGVTAPGWQAADVAVVWLALGVPPLRLLARRARPLDLALLGLRAAMTAALAPAYARRGPAYWLSPAADPLAALRLTLSAVRPARRWRGRTYPAAAGRAPR